MLECRAWLVMGVPAGADGLACVGIVIASTATMRESSCLFFLIPD